MGGTGQPESRSPIERVGDVIFGADRQVAAWMAARIPGLSPSPQCRALGVIKGDKMAAGVLYENFNGVHIEAAIAAEPGIPWLSRRTLHSFFFYPFVTLNCRAITVSVPSTNLPSLNLATKMGFEPEALVAFAAHDGSTLVVMKQFREKCRWIESYGQEGRGRTSST